MHRGYLPREGRLLYSLCSSEPDDQSSCPWSDRVALKSILWRTLRIVHNKLDWFKSLPFWIAVRLLILHLGRKVARLPVSFSFAQGGEDLVFSYVVYSEFGNPTSGTYIDVGCYSPIKWSNTFDLYLRGWRGI